jgi:hypothetical protein
MSREWIGEFRRASKVVLSMSEIAEGRAMRRNVIAPGKAWERRKST